MVLMELIKTNEELVDVCKSISEEKFITIDTEFIREKTYWSKLCLIQICTHNKEIIIDPLENNIDLYLAFRKSGNSKTVENFIETVRKVSLDAKEHNQI